MAISSPGVSGGLDERGLDTELIRIYVRGRKLMEGTSWIRTGQPLVEGFRQRKLRFFHDEEIPKPDPEKASSLDTHLEAEHESYLEACLRAMAQADCYLYHQPRNDKHAAFWTRLREENRDHPEGPPIIVCDYDDNTRFMSPFNPQYPMKGTHDPHGTQVDIGGSIRVKDSNGEVHTMWADGELYPGGRFDVARNLLSLENLERNARAADAISVSTPAMARWMESLGCSDIHVRHNMVAKVDYGDYEVDYHEPYTRVLWHGGNSHAQDLLTIRSSLLRIAERFLNVKFIFFGAVNERLVRELPVSQVELHPPIVMPGFHVKLASLAPDICIAPITKEPFNEHRSALKWYQSSALYRPAATLATDFGPYQEITDDENGLLYDGSTDHFEHQLARLIENETLRKRLARNAHTWVWENRSTHAVIPPWVDWLNEVRARVRFSETRHAGI